MSRDWAQLFGTAGESPRAAVPTLSRHGVHLSLARADAAGTHVRFEILSVGPLAFHDIEDALGIPGLAARAAAVPIDRVDALRAALREGRAGFYADPVEFVGAALRNRPALVRLVRGIVRWVGLGGAAVAPVGREAVVCIVGSGLVADVVAPFSDWAAQLRLD